MKGECLKTAVTLANTLDAILTSIGTFFTQVIGWIGEIVEVVATEPILLLMVVLMPCAGYAVGYVRRLIRL